MQVHKRFFNNAFANIMQVWLLFFKALLKNYTWPSW
jgi:hypothetical protein